MRRTAPFLLAAALLVAAGPVAVADPAAEVGPGSVDPGGSVTVSVSCDPLDGPAPETLDAVSQAFSEGTVKLVKVSGDVPAKASGGVPGEVTGGASANVPGDASGDAPSDVSGGLPGEASGDVPGGLPGDVPGDVSGGASGDVPGDVSSGASGNVPGEASGDVPGEASGNVPGEASGGVSTGLPGDGEKGTGPSYQGSAHIAPDLGRNDGRLGPDTAWTVDGTCPAPPGGRGSPWSATFDVNRPTSASGGSADASGIPPCLPAPGQNAPSCDGGPACPHDKPCPTAHPTQRPTTPATVEHGVRAGTGGTFRDSVPALVAGGLLIAGAFGAAAHRLLRRRRPAADA